MSQTFCSEVSEHLAAVGSALLALSDGYPWTTHKLNASVSTLWFPHTSFLDAILVFHRWNINTNIVFLWSTKKYDIQAWRVFFLYLQWTMSQVSPSTTYSFLLAHFCPLSWWSAFLDFPSAATKRCLCTYQEIIDIPTGVFESLHKWQDVPAVQHCHLWRHKHNLLATTWLRDAAGEHSCWPHSPLESHRAHQCSSYSLSVCYIQVKPCFFNFVHVSYVLPSGKLPRLWS